MNPTTKISLWIIVCLLLGLLGAAVGLRSVIPGPSSIAALKLNSGERIALEHGLPPTDGLVVIISADDSLAEIPTFPLARDRLVSLLKGARQGSSIRPLFSLIQTSRDNISLGENSFISRDQRHEVVVAQSGIPVFRSSQEFKQIPPLLADWQKEFPDLLHSK